MLDRYTDYLISSFGFTTATGMSTALDGAVSHDHVTRFLSERLYTNTDLWKLVKPTIRQMETDDGVLVVDDTIEEKLQGIFHAVESLTWEENTHVNHFALKAKHYLKAQQVSLAELQVFKTQLAVDFAEGEYRDK